MERGRDADNEPGKELCKSEECIVPSFGRALAPSDAEQVFLAQKDHRERKSFPEKIIHGVYSPCLFHGRYGLGHYKWIAEKDSTAYNFYR